MKLTTIQIRRAPRRRATGPGFTLTEILIAVAIAAVLAALLGFMGSKYIDRARSAHCISNLRQIGVGAGLMSADHEGRLPDRLETVRSGNYPYSIGDYLYSGGVPQDGGCYSCPSATNRKKSSLGASLGNSSQNGWLSYGINLACSYKDADGKQQQYRIFQVPNPSKRMLAIESNTWNCNTNAMTRYAPRHRGSPTTANKLGEMGNILFMDGHVESRVMSMSPIDQNEWDELGTWSQIQGRSNILK